MCNGDRLTTSTRLLGPIAVLLIGFLAGCSTVSVSNDYDPAVNFTKLKTYGWIENKQDPDEAPSIGENTLLTSRIERSVDSVLASMGMEKVARSDADFLVSQHIAVQQKLQVNTTQFGYGYGYGYGAWGGPIGVSPSQTTVSQYEQGTLVIDFVQPENRNLIWRGTGQSRVRKSTSPEERQKRIRTAVDEILGQFPPAKK